MSIHTKLGPAVVVLWSKAAKALSTTPSKGVTFAGLAVLTAGLAACGGGGYDGGGNPPPPPARQAPQIVGLTNQTLPQDTSTPVLTFQVSDADSGANAVTVTAISSDQTIIPAAGIVLGGSGANRTLQITPAADTIGNATITLRAVDPDGLVTQQMVGVMVNGVFVSFTNTLIDLFGDAENGEPRSPRGFTLDDDADDNPTAFDSLLQ
jgi:hypothetical protein